MALTSSDPNGNTTTHAYNSGSTGEPYWRKLSAEDPNGYTTTLTYPNSSTPDASSITVPISGSTTDTTTFTVDGYGRPIDVQKAAPGSKYDTVSTGYLWETSGTYNTYFQTSVSQPCSTTSLGNNCTTVHFSYRDPLGRTSVSNTTSNETVTNTFSATSSAYYALSVLTPAPAGENAKQIQIAYDGLGRVTSICHIGSTANTGSGTACPSGSYNGAVDLYTYSAGTGYTTVSVTRGSQTRTNTYDALGRLAQNVTPEGGTWNYDYDTSACTGAVTAKGLLVCTRDSGGNQTTYQYDSLKRSTHIGNPSYCKNFRYDNTSGVLGSLPTGVTLTNQYGRLVEAETDDCNPSPSASDVYADEWFAYDEDGHALNQWQWSVHSTQYYKSTASFYANGAVNTLQLASPSLYTMTWGIDGEGRMSTLTNTTYNQDFATGASYYPAANPASVSLTGSNSDSFTIDINTGKLNKYAYTVASQTLSGTLTWNANGTLSQLYTQDGLRSTTQTCNDVYDDWTRLVSFDCGSGNWGQDYSYDIYDNLSKSVISGRTGTTWNPGYNASNNHCNICSYDGYGDVTADGISNYGFDGYEKLFSTGATSYSACDLSGSGRCILYDAFGRMVEYSNNGSWSEVWYTQAGTATMNGGSIEWGKFPAPMGATALVQGNVTQYFYLHPDWVGSSRLISTPGNNTNPWLSDASFTPYGETIALYGTNTPWNSFAGTTEEFDSGVMWDTPNRELSAVGRWLSPDPSGQGGQWNRYAYSTNPNSLSDPSGLGPGNNNNNNSTCSSDDNSGEFGCGAVAGWTDGGTETGYPESPYDPAAALPDGGDEVILYTGVNGPLFTFYTNTAAGGFDLVSTDNDIPIYGWLGLGSELSSQVGALTETPYEALSIAFGAETVGLAGAYVGGGTILDWAISPGYGESVFWSGYADGALDVASTIGTPISSTPAGAAFDLVDGLLPQSAQNAGWNYLSAQYAQAATGPINVVIGESATGASTFWGTEFPILVNNPTVTSWTWTLIQ